MPSYPYPIYRGTIFINYGRYGWSETFDLASIDQSGVVRVMKNLALFRSYFLPNNATVSYARAQLRGTQRKSITCLDGPFVGKAETLTTPELSFMNDPSSSLCFRVQGQDQSHTTRFLRGIPDSRITDTTLVGGVPADGWTGSETIDETTMPVPATWMAALQRYLKYISLWTSIVVVETVPSANGGTAEVYSAKSLVGFLFRGIRNKKTGRPFDLSRGRGAIR